MIICKLQSDLSNSVTIEKTAREGEEFVNWLGHRFSA